MRLFKQGKNLCSHCNCLPDKCLSDVDNLKVEVTCPKRKHKGGTNNWSESCPGSFINASFIQHCPRFLQGSNFVAWFTVGFPFTCVTEKHETWLSSWSLQIHRCVRNSDKCIWKSVLIWDNNVLQSQTSGWMEVLSFLPWRIRGFVTARVMWVLKLTSTFTCK